MLNALYSLAGAAGVAGGFYILVAFAVGSEPVETKLALLRGKPRRQDGKQWMDTPSTMN